MPVTRADEMDARPADNAKELLALYKRELARLINDGFANGDNGARIVELAELNGFLDRVKERLSARQQASVDEVARTFDPSAFVDLGPGFKRAQKIEMELVTLKARALLAKYDIFEKVEG